MAKNRWMAFLFVAALVVADFTLSSCGKKGLLYLPTKEKRQSSSLSFRSPSTSANTQGGAPNLNPANVPVES